MSKKYANCSGDPASCPENEGHGCCKPNPQRLAQGESWFADALASVGEVIPMDTQPPHQDRGEVSRTIEVLRAIGSAFDGIPAPCEERDAIEAAITALTEAKQQGRTEPEVCPSCFWTNPKPQEPVEAVAEVEQFGETEDARAIQPIGRMPPVGTKLYTAPQVGAKQQDDDGWEANFRYLLDRSPHTLRSREGGGHEDLMQSAILTFTRMEHKLETKQQGPGEVVRMAMELADEWRWPAQDVGHGHDVIANRNTVSRFIKAIDSLTAALTEAKRQSEPAADRCPHGIRNPHPCRECEDSPLQVEDEQPNSRDGAALVKLWRDQGNAGYMTGKPEIDNVTAARQEVYFECANALEKLGSSPKVVSDAEVDVAIAKLFATHRSDEEKREVAGYARLVASAYYRNRGW